MKLIIFAFAAIIASCFVSFSNAQTDVPAYCSAGNYSCSIGQPCACRNNGTCTVTGVTCSCIPLAWTGLQCQTPVCTRRNNCNSGRCIAPDTCNCTGTGYAGDSCEIPVCSPPCAHGSCIAPNSCGCSGTGYTGALCEVPLCEDIGGCLRGYCELPNQCNCTGTGWSGVNCELPVCVNPCVNGYCIGPNACQCPSNFGGTYCETALCTPACQNLGFCQAGPNNTTNFCNCSSAIGWTGSYCNTPQCSQPCLNGGRCTGPNNCDCRGTGYAGAQCQNEINECLGTPRPCSPVSTCTNTPGNYTCSPCPSGYNGTGYGAQTGCVDINECNLGYCDRLTNCTNTVGNFSCTPCPSGYSGTPRSGCVDINECAQGACSPHANCTNLPGSFNCSACYPGYRGSGFTSQGGCQDIDECDPANRVCDPIVTCQNLDGSFYCAPCPDGYTGTPLTGCNPTCEPSCQNNGTCIRPNVCSCTGTGFTGALCESDRNECADPLSCDRLTNCTNEYGSYSCTPCPPNYTGTGKTGCIPICNPQCQNGGICSAPNQCSCAKNWAGDSCEEYVEDVSGSPILSLGAWAVACVAFCFFFYM